MKRVKILGISGSLRSSSSNSSIVRATAKLAANKADFIIFDGIGDLPHFNPELEKEVAPEAVTHFREALTNSDAVFICTPEYAFGVPGVLKNALDWVVGSNEVTNKRIAVVSASPLVTGGENAQASLLLTLKTMSAALSGSTNLAIPFVYKKINEKGEITDPLTVVALENVIDNLVTLVLEQQDMTANEA